MPDLTRTPREKAVRFGDSTTLVGVLAEAPPDLAPDSRPGVIMLNSGILHHIGSCRLHVHIARRLAASGLHALRFDHAGIGDSESRKDTLPFVKSAPLEVREAMDYLSERKGNREFILVGLCSGADMAYNVAVEDERVVGMVQMDAYAYRTPGYYLRHYAPRVLRLRPWVSFVRRRVRTLFGREERRITREDLSDDYVPPEYRRVFPPRETVAEGLGKITGRGIYLLNIFTGGHGEHLNYRGQYRAAFPEVDFGDLLEVEYFAEADHIFTNLAHQRMVVERIHDWATQRWPVAEPLAAAS